MKTVSKFGAFLMVAAVAAPASAAVTTFQGSDTLKVVTQQMIRVCYDAGVLADSAGSTIYKGMSGATNTPRLSYLGGGSGAGENNMKLAVGTTNAQPIAPMSRPLRDPLGLVVQAAAPDLCNDATEHHQLVIARDALSLVTKASNIAGVQSVDPALTQSDRCENMKESGSVAVLTDNGDATIQCPAGSYCTGSGASLAYPLKDWKDILRVAYFGLLTDASGATTTDCNSDIRHSVLSDIKNFSNAASDCTVTGVTGPVTHLWRRDDLSGTTDSFRAALGIASTAQFCNSGAGGVVNPGIAAPVVSDEVDQDPIRRACQGTPNSAGADAVCGCDGKLGVVQAITVPAGYTVAQLYYRDAVTNPTGVPDCSTARSIAQVGDTVTGPSDKCLFNLKNASNAPQQYSSLSGKCIVPVATGGVYGCRWKSSPITLSSCDNRVFNMQARNPVSGNLLTNPDNNRPVLNGVFRVRTECMELDSTQQIGCLAFYYPNSIGYAGFEATNLVIAGSPNVVGAYRIKGVKGTEATVNKNVDDVYDGGNFIAGSTDTNNVSDDQGYVFGRGLYVNSFFGATFDGGFDDLAATTYDSGFSELMTCFNNPQFLEWAIKGPASAIAPPASVGVLEDTKFFPARDALVHTGLTAYAAQEAVCHLDAAP